MKILCACEESQTVTKAFRALGHMAYSCDILPCSGGRPEWHLQCDVLNILENNLVNDIWDMIIAFPPCTDLAVSGAAWFEKKRKDGRQQKSIDFILLFTIRNIPDNINLNTYDVIILSYEDKSIYGSISKWVNLCEGFFFNGSPVNTIIYFNDASKIMYNAIKDYNDWREF
jgi:hypothetical protein